MYVCINIYIRMRVDVFAHVCIRAHKNACSHAQTDIYLPINVEIVNSPPGLLSRFLMAWKSWSDGATQGARPTLRCSGDTAFTGVGLAGVLAPCKLHLDI